NLSKKILLVFYPRDNTPVCTKQLSDYQMNKNELESYGIILVGINADSEETHLNFAAKCSLDFPLLADPDRSVSKKFKAINLFGGIKRKLVMIDGDRKIIFEDEIISIKYRTSGQLKAMLLNL